MEPELKVLIVDDDPAVRRVLERALLKEGYQVSLASDGDEALGLVSHEPFDLVLMDLRIPGIAGKSLYNAMLADRPDLQRRIIAMSGDTKTDNAEEWFGERGVAVVAKPFDLPELISLVERVALGKLSNKSTN